MAYQVPVLADFRTLFPELADPKVTDARITFWLKQATPFFNLERWDDLLFLGMLYWVAHSCTLQTTNATQANFDDALTKKVGDIMKTRSERLMVMQSDNPYYKTTYGQQYLDYQQMVGVGGYSV